MIGMDELSAMRQAVIHALPDSAEVQRATALSDGLGGQTIVWITVTTLPCRLSLPTSGTPGITMLGQMLGERIANRVVFVASFLASSDVRAGDRIIVDGRNYEVLSVINGSWEIARRAIVVEV